MGREGNSRKGKRRGGGGGGLVVKEHTGTPMSTQYTSLGNVTAIGT